MIENIDDLENLLTDQLYVSDRDLATVIYLALKLKKPLFLEGEAGVGKTEVAKVLSKGLGRDCLLPTICTLKKRLNKNREIATTDISAIYTQVIRQINVKDFRFFILKKAPDGRTLNLSFPTPPAD